MVDTVHSGHVGQKGLGITNIAGGFVPPYMLFTGLKSQSETIFVICISIEQSKIFCSSVELSA